MLRKILRIPNIYTAFIYYFCKAQYLQINVLECANYTVKSHYKTVY